MSRVGRIILFDVYRGFFAGKCGNSLEMLDKGKKKLYTKFYYEANESEKRIVLLLRLSLPNGREILLCVNSV
jgi:hypothetical protein